MPPLPPVVLSGECYANPEKRGGEAVGTNTCSDPRCDCKSIGSVHRMKPIETDPQLLAKLQQAKKDVDDMSPKEYARMLAVQALNTSVFYSFHTLKDDFEKGDEVSEQGLEAVRTHLENIRDLVNGNPNREMAVAHWGSVLQFRESDKNHAIMRVNEYLDVLDVIEKKLGENAKKT